MKRGTVTSVDRDKHTVAAECDGGLLKIIAAKYTGTPPWVGDTAGFERIGSNRWVCTGTLGQRSNLGPNVLTNPNGDTRPIEVCPNPTIDDDIAPWATNTGATTTVARTTTSPRTGPGAMLLTRNTSTGAAQAALPLALCPKAEPGRTYNGVMWARGVATTRNALVILEFYDATDTLIQTYTGPTVSVGTGAWVEAWMTGTAPPGAVKWRAVLSVQAMLAAETFKIDDIEMHEAVVDVATTGAKAFLFDTDIEGWFSPDGLTTLAWSNVEPLSPPGDVLLTVAGTTLWVESPNGLGASPVVAGRSYSAFGYLKPIPPVAGTAAAERLGHIYIAWFNSAGTYLGFSSDGPDTLITNGDYTSLVLGTVKAPAGAAFASVGFMVDATVAGEQWRLDTGVLVQPSNLRMRVNEDPTYIHDPAVANTSIRLRSLASGISFVQFPWGVNGDAVGTIPVVPGDDWRGSLWYKNDAGNPTKRNILLVATWYDVDGDFMGINLGVIQLSANPGDDWHEVAAAFKVPDGVAGMRMRAVFLAGGGGEIMYLSEVRLQRVELVENRLVPQGAVPPFDHGLARVDQVDRTANQWNMSNWVLIGHATGIPVKIRAVLNGIVQAFSGVTFQFIRVGISLDGGYTWTTSAFEPYSSTDSGYIGVTPVTASHEVTNLPLGDIYVWCETYQNQFASMELYGEIDWSIMPAD